MSVAGPLQDHSWCDTFTPRQNSDLAEKRATTFDRHAREKVLDTLTANINKRYIMNIKWKATFHSNYTSMCAACEKHRFILG